MTVYVDSSALAKLLVAEEESGAVAQHLATALQTLGLATSAPGLPPRATET